MGFISQAKKVSKQNKEKINQATQQLGPGDSVVVIYSSCHDKVLNYYTNRQDLLDFVMESLDLDKLENLFSNELREQGTLLTLPSRSIETMSNRELRPFTISMMKEYAILAERPSKKPGYNDPLMCPKWWPDSVFWQDNALQKANKEGLKSIIRACFNYFKVQSDLLAPIGIDENTSSLIDSENEDEPANSVGQTDMQPDVTLEDVNEEFHGTSNPHTEQNLVKPLGQAYLQVDKYSLDDDEEYHDSSTHLTKGIILPSSACVLPLTSEVGSSHITQSVVTSDPDPPSQIKLKLIQQDLEVESIVKCEEPTWDFSDAITCACSGVFHSEWLQNGICGRCSQPQELQKKRKLPQEGQAKKRLIRSIGSHPPESVGDNIRVLVQKVEPGTTDQGHF